MKTLRAFVYLCEADFVAAEGYLYSSNVLLLIDNPREIS